MYSDYHFESTCVHTYIMLPEYNPRASLPDPTYRFHLITPIVMYSVMVVLARARTLVRHVLLAIISDATPETVCVAITQVRQHQLQAILCLREEKESEYVTTDEFHAKTEHQK